MVGVLKQVSSDGGLTEVTLGELRTELGYDRLGRWVLDEIRGSLADQGLGYFPLERLDPEKNNKPRQDQRVWLYRRDGGLRATILDAVLNPDDHDVAVALADLEDTVELDAEQQLERIRRIVNGDPA